MARQKICETKYSVTLDWPYRGDRSMGPHHRALEIAQSETAERKSLAAIITLHKFFIDRFSPFLNNRFVGNMSPGENGGTGRSRQSKVVFFKPHEFSTNHRCYFFAKRSVAPYPRRV